MDILTLKQQIDENFSEFNFSTSSVVNFTLAESEFYDTYGKAFSEYSKDHLYLKLKENYNEGVAKFIINNMVDNQYIEPFENWSQIPLWYYKAFCFGGEIYLTTDNFIYYIAGFMNATTSNDDDKDFSLNNLWWWDQILDGEHVSKLLSEKLNHKQLETIELFLCYDSETQTFDISEP